jgi:hypothetical protein
MNGYWNGYAVLHSVFSGVRKKPYTFFSDTSVAHGRKQHFYHQWMGGDIETDEECIL